MKIAIIGAGAAGCFCAINLKRMMPQAEIHIYESKQKALAKVAVTGGGRCNLTNTFKAVKQLKDVYPRGDKLMRRALSVFSEKDTVEWFEAAGVRLVAQEDECIFPASQDAMQIVNTLSYNIKGLGIHLHLGHKVERLDLAAFDSTVVTTGGHATPKGYELLNDLDIKMEPPIPSLFTFNVEGNWHQLLMGTVVDASVSIAGSKLKSSGPLLLTHWGMSGPAILKLSSFAARYLAEHQYECDIIVNWMNEMSEQEVRDMLHDMIALNAQKMVTSVFPTNLTSKHWGVLLGRAGIPATHRWGALNAKQFNKLTNVLTADTYHVTGKCSFKEEFVTCGGVSLKAININTLESKQYPGLYFAGEVLDVDAVTGGFNLQAAWSMAYVVAKAISERGL